MTGCGIKPQGGMRRTRLFDVVFDPVAQIQRVAEYRSEDDQEQRDACPGKDGVWRYPKHGQNEGDGNPEKQPKERDFEDVGDVAPGFGEGERFARRPPFLDRNTVLDLALFCERVARLELLFAQSFETLLFVIGHFSLHCVYNCTGFSPHVYHE